MTLSPNANGSFDSLFLFVPSKDKFRVELTHRAGNKILINTSRWYGIEKFNEAVEHFKKLGFKE